MKEAIKSIIKAIVILALSLSAFTGLAFFMDTVQTKEDVKDWNGGICAECGGHYVFSATGRNSYYYTCDECGHTIATSRLMK